MHREIAICKNKDNFQLGHRRKRGTSSVDRGEGGHVMKNKEEEAKRGRHLQGKECLDGERPIVNDLGL